MNSLYSYETPRLENQWPDVLTQYFLVWQPRDAAIQQQPRSATLQEEQTVNFVCKQDNACLAE